MNNNGVLHRDYLIYLSCTSSVMKIKILVFRLQIFIPSFLYICEIGINNYKKVDESNLVEGLVTVELVVKVVGISRIMMEIRKVLIRSLWKCLRNNCEITIEFVEFMELYFWELIGIWNWFELLEFIGIIGITGVLGINWN